MLFSSVSNYGYQLVSANSALPKAVSDPQMLSIEAVLRGSHGEDGGNEPQPTLVIAAHYDSDSVAPSLTSGVNSNGSGVTILMELARIFGKLYASSRSRPPMGLAFLLSSGGALNYFGAKKWLESHLDQDSNLELLNDVPFAVCLDSLCGSAGDEKLKMHVSKPPKSDTHAGKFMANLGASNVEMIHKKINLADELLAWEHERFSIRRLPAFTLSGLKSNDKTERTDILDKSVDDQELFKKVKIIGESLACTLYNYAEEGCSGNVLAGSLAPSKEYIKSWIDLVSETPRFPSMTSGKNDLFVQTLLAGMKSAVGNDNVRSLKAKTDKREPEFILYDGASTTITAYKVKPAVFDLVLTLCIGAYLGMVYLAIMKGSYIVNFVSSLTTPATATTSLSPNGSPMNGKMNGNGTLLHSNGVNGHANGQHLKVH